MRWSYTVQHQCSFFATQCITQRVGRIQRRRRRRQQSTADYHQACVKLSQSNNDWRRNSSTQHTHRRRTRDGQRQFDPPGCTLTAIKTSNVTGRHRGPKRKRTCVCRYVAPPGECYYNTVLCCAYYLSSSSVVSRAFSALCVYSKFEHHPHPLGYLCAKFCFFGGLHCWASAQRKIGYSIAHSPTHSAYLMPLCGKNSQVQFYS